MIQRVRPRGVAARLAAAAVLALALASPALAERLRPAPVRDPDFGVEAAAIALERRVEMYQWVEVAGGATPRYALQWRAGLVDSGAFREPRGHANPSEFPIVGGRWQSPTVTLDGHPVDPAAFARSEGWRPLRPDPARLPPNMAVSFGPDGEGLTSAADPAAPQLGDVRLRWRMLPAPEAPTGLVLQGGRWVLPGATQPVGPSTPATPGDAVADAGAPPPAAAADGPGLLDGLGGGDWRLPAIEGQDRTMLVYGGIALLVVIVVIALRARRGGGRGRGRGSRGGGGRKRARKR